MDDNTEAFGEQTFDFRPKRSVLVVSGNTTSLIPAAGLTKANIGWKAYGLTCVPDSWTLDFFVISGSQMPTASAIAEAISILDFANHEHFYVRSSGANESILERGKLDSEKTILSSLIACIARLTGDAKHQLGLEACVHWLVQPYVHPAAKGHLSNERHLRKDRRDWVAEFEGSSHSLPEVQDIPLRPWRDGRAPSLKPLRCPYRANCLDCLKEVAKWGYVYEKRFHFEWVWSGDQVIIVQADECLPSPDGVDPNRVFNLSSGPATRHENLRVFRVAVGKDFDSYRKLHNAEIYRSLGYDLSHFVILDDTETLRALLHGRIITEDLEHDLWLLSNDSFVLRTDGDIKDSSKQMLPRSDELRNYVSAKNWLLNEFCKIIFEKRLQDNHLCLIGHNFIPSAASAWCQASMDGRRVRIEALWGIPEGLYWYAYDSFDVDTVDRVPTSAAIPKNLTFKSRIRYKGRFVAPDKNGNWVLHRTADGLDWRRAIKKSEWIKEVAWASRRIALASGHDVVVMWFIDVDRNGSQHKVLPWYHERWENSASNSRAAPTTKSRANYRIETVDDWENLKKRLSNNSELISRVKVQPVDASLIRNREFAEHLAKLAREYSFVVELEGGILSHAYYVLSRENCIVELKNLDDFIRDDDEVAFNKLVRDKIPKQIIERGEDVRVTHVQKEALIESLKRKLVEEAYEVLDASSSIQITRELADLSEVISALSKRLGITEQHIQEERVSKSSKRGGFDDGVMLLATESPTPFQLDASNGLAFTPDDSHSLPPIKNTISETSRLPEPVVEFNVDTRRHADRANEKQIIFKVPAYSADIAKRSVQLSTGTTVSISADRDGSVYRWKIQIFDSPKQLSFDLED